MQTLTTRDLIIRRETMLAAGWSAVDDDLPRVPELDPLASAQARRAHRLEQQPAAVITAP